MSNSIFKQWICQLFPESRYCQGHGPAGLPQPVEGGEPLSEELPSDIDEDPLADLEQWIHSYNSNSQNANSRVYLNKAILRLLRDENDTAAVLLVDAAVTLALIEEDQQVVYYAGLIAAEYLENSLIKKESLKSAVVEAQKTQVKNALNEEYQKFIKS